MLVSEGVTSNMTVSSTKTRPDAVVAGEMKGSTPGVVVVESESTASQPGRSARDGRETSRVQKKSSRERSRSPYQRDTPPSTKEHTTVSEETHKPGVVNMEESSSLPKVPLTVAANEPSELIVVSKLSRRSRSKPPRARRGDEGSITFPVEVEHAVNRSRSRSPRKTSSDREV